MSLHTGKYLRALPLLLGIVVLIAYLPVLNCGFVNFDDDSHVRLNPVVAGGLSLSGIARAFTEPHAALWIPLTWISYMTDVSLFGMNPTAFHAVNVLFHVANVVILFLLLHRMTGRLWPSMFAAAIFGVHPLNVESVAWIAERKNVLCGFFFLLCLYAYQDFAKRPRWPIYLLSLLSAALALLAKPMAVTLPFVLLLLDYWPLERYRRHEWRRLVVEKLPFAALSVASSLVALASAQNARSNELLQDITFGNRFRNALVSYSDYLSNIFWPADLAVLYPHPFVISWLPALLALGALLMITGAAYLLRQRFPYILWGWLWFLGILVPMIGVVQVGPQARADRFTYLSQIGVFVAVTFLAADAVKERYSRFLPVAALGLVAVLMTLTGGQLSHWTHTAHLFEHTARVTENNTRAFALAGKARMDLGDYSAAARNYSAAIKLHPELDYLWVNLGRAFEKQQRTDEAQQCFARALSLNPNSTEALQLHRP